MKITSTIFLEKGLYEDKSYTYFLKWMFVYHKCQLYFDRIEVSEGIDVNKTSEPKVCDICHYWYFLNVDLKFQLTVCNGCHNLLMMLINLCNIAILNINDSNYRCIVSEISKIEVINLMKNIDLPKKCGTL